MTADTTSTTSQDFFEGKYCDGRDPWHFTSSPYERNRYATILRTIRHRRYRQAFEPGCSIGMLTARLALICDYVEAIDIAPSAVKQARERCSNHVNVRVSCESLSTVNLQGSFDLIVFCEIGYYFEAVELRRMVSKLAKHVASTGIMLAAHWLGNSNDHVLSGDAVHDILRSTNEQEGLILNHSERQVGFRLDRWVKA